MTTGQFACYRTGQIKNSQQMHRYSPTRRPTYRILQSRGVGKDILNRLLNFLCRSTRIFSLADGAPYDDVISTIMKRLRDINSPLLVIYRFVLNRADARRHHQQFIAQLSADCRGFQT